MAQARPETCAQSGLIEAMREVKSADELELLRASTRLNEKVFQSVHATIEPGMTEREIALALELTMREMGAEGPSFPTIVAFGTNAARPHAVPTDRELQAGDLVLIDMGLVLRGYCSDMSRTFVAGKPDPTFIDRHRVVRAAMLAGIGAIRAGVTGAAVDRAARQVIADAGYGDCFGHSLGHGVGLAVHEAPRLPRAQPQEAARRHGGHGRAGHLPARLGRHPPGKHGGGGRGRLRTPQPRHHRPRPLTPPGPPTARRIMSSKFFVLDTNVLLHNSDAITCFADNTVVLPMTVIEELDKFKKNNDELGRNARRVIRTLDGLRGQGSLGRGRAHRGRRHGADHHGEEESGGTCIDLDIPDNRIIATAFRLLGEGKRVIFVSKDINARLKADALGIEVQDFEREKADFDQLYTGLRRLPVDGATIDRFHHDKTLHLDTGGLQPNEFVLLVDTTNERTRHRSGRGRTNCIPSTRPTRAPTTCTRAAWSSASPWSCCSTRRSRWSRSSARPAPARRCWRWPPGWPRPSGQAATRSCSSAGR